MVRKTVTTAEYADAGAPVEACTPAQGLTLDGEFSALRSIVERAYEQGIGLDEAERLASKTLGVQLHIAEQLAIADLDARMKKNGLKAIKAAVYMEAATRGDKKPSDSFLENVVTLDTNVTSQQDIFDRADAYKQSLETYMGIFRDAHIHFRTLAKGAFNG